jgi:hypothetical protein
MDASLFRRLRADGMTPSPMSDRAVARLVQARAAAAGYVAEDFGGHSLRAYAPGYGGSQQLEARQRSAASATLTELAGS